MSNEAEVKYGEDLGVREELSAYIDEWQELQKLKAALSEAKEELLSRFERDFQAEIKRVEVLEQLFVQKHRQLNDYVGQETIVSDRRKFLGGHVISQVRRRVREYNYGDVLDWVQRHEWLELMTIPEEPAPELLEHLRDTHPEWLVVDTKMAEKKALLVNDHGFPIYKDSPIPFDTYVTQVSEKTFSKLMDELVLEHEVDVRSTNPKTSD